MSRLKNRLPVTLLTVTFTALLTWLLVIIDPLDSEKSEPEQPSSTAKKNDGNTQAEPPVTIEAEEMKQNEVDTDKATLNAMIIHFSSGTELKVEDLGLVIQAAQILQKNEEFGLLVTGYSDPEGTEASNLEMGMKRAETVESILLKQGISDDRLIIRSKGEQNLVDRVDLALNRRVEFKVVML